MAGLLQRDILNLVGAGEYHLSRWIRRLAGILPSRFSDIWTEEPPLLFVPVLESDSDTPPALAPPDSGASSWRMTPVIACLPTSRVLKRYLRVPDASLRDLRNVVRNDLDRLVPLPAHLLDFDIKRTGEPDRTGSVELVLRVVRRSDIESARSELARSGKTANAFAIAGEWQDYSRSTFDFERRTPFPYLVRKWASPLLLLLVLGAMITFLLAASQHSDAVIAQLEHELSVRKPLVEQQIETQKGLAETEKAFAETVLNRPHHLAITVLDEISHLLPDSASVETFEFSRGLVRIRGQARDGGALVPLLSASSSFSGVRLASPLTTVRMADDRGTQLERFDIELRPVSPSSRTGGRP